MRRYPLLRMVEWIAGNRVRLFFSTGRVVEMSLPVKSAKRARVVDYGMGLDPGDGLEFSAPDLYRRRAVELRPAPRRKPAPMPIIIAGEGRISPRVLEEATRPRKRP